MAESLNRTHAELMQTISDTELANWRVLREVQAEEHEIATREAFNK